MGRTVNGTYAGVFHSARAPRVTRQPLGVEEQTVGGCKNEKENSRKGRKERETE